MSRTHEELTLENFRNASQATTLEWGITMLFYAAVHAADHVLHPGGAPESNYDHKTRQGLIRGDRRLKTVERQYEELKTLSRYARYCPAKHPMSPDKRRHAENLAKLILQRAGFQLPAPVANTELRSTATGPTGAGSDDMTGATRPR
jgi:hypothetical protein